MPVNPVTTKARPAMPCNAPAKGITEIIAAVALSASIVVDTAIAEASIDFQS